MAEKSKFAGLKDMRAAAPEKVAEAVPSENAFTPRQPTGKRSNAEYRQTAVLLKIASQAEARKILKTRYNGRDFSELVQSLLDNWLQKEMTS